METMSLSLLSTGGWWSVDAAEGITHALEAGRYAQREAGLIAAMINAQGAEGDELLEAGNHCLGQGSSEAEREMLHLGAVGKNVDQCICHPHWLRRSARLFLGALGGDGQVADEPVVLLWDGGCVLVEGLGVSDVDGLARG